MSPRQPSDPSAASRGESPSPRPRPGWKKWSFRCLALLLVPLAAFGMIEAGLRWAGAGYPTRFLLPIRLDGKELWVQNNQFGWRFFGASMARTPFPIAISRAKSPETIRIFVFGESAAYGDPQPRFGLSRVLQAMLSLRYPGVHFEVVNAAMTGINSHAIVSIAQDCKPADGDIWVLYIGNNEVVGPFGAGTIFGPRTPPRSLIRSRLALLSTRTGQTLDAWLQRMRPRPFHENEWGGMQMFLKHPIRADDPSLAVVYDHFERNLVEIIETGRQSGAKVVVSTVAVNLQDCGPFASVSGRNLGPAEKAKWQDEFQRGLDALKGGEPATAATWLGQAAALDDTVAELRFRQAECALRLGQIAEAKLHLRAACDLDTLRFRCDSRLNERVKKIAAARVENQVRLADAEQAFADQSPNGLPGRQLFCDHVHFTFEGTHRLALTIAAQIERLLPERVQVHAAKKKEWPSAAACAQRVGWTDWNQQSVVAEMLSRLNDPPFTGQLNHDDQVRFWSERLREFKRADNPARLRAVQEATTAALVVVPEDSELHLQLAGLRLQGRDLAGAEASARQAITLLPSSREAWSQLGLIQAERQRFAEAAAAFRSAFAWDRQDVWALQNLAQALIKLGQNEKAVEEYRRAVAIKPRFGMAWLGLGQLLELQGRKAEAADCFQKALANRIRRPGELTTLARFCQSRGWSEAARTNYLDAIQLNPGDVLLRLELARALAGWGRHGDAAAQCAAAVSLAPDMSEAHFMLGLQAGRLGQADLAVEQFREAVRLKPDLPEARINLGVALMNQGQLAAALAELEGVLQRDPANAAALRQAQAVRARMAGAGR